MSSQKTEMSLPVVSASGTSEHACGCGAGACGSHEPKERPLWKSLEEKSGAPDFLAARKNEFPEGATEPPTGVARREFLGMAGAALALAGATGCNYRRAEKILPYTNQPHGLAPGNPLHYASAATAVNGYGQGLLVTSWEGRPTKVEGNPDHPASRGATGVFEQALHLQVYDPDRGNLIKNRQGQQAWRGFLADLKNQLKQHEGNGGERLRFLVGQSTSPLLLALKGQLLTRFPKARFVTYESAGRDAAYEGARLAFGRPVEQRADLSKADVVVSLDADFLQPLPENVRMSMQFADRRDPEAGNVNRLYVAESMFTVTGTIADHRLRVRSQDVGRVALALLSKLQSPVAAAAGQAAGSGPWDKWVDAVAKDLTRAAGKSVVLVGDRQPAAVHAVAHAINAALGNHGATLQFTSPVVHDPAGGLAQLKQLADELKAGAVDTLVITAWNPVYAAPAELGLADGIAKVPHSIYWGLFEDETSQHCTWYLPALHELESWGDARSADGTAMIRQPLVQPLFTGVGDVELFSAFLGNPDVTAYDQLRTLWGQETGGFNEDEWQTWLVRGVIPNSTLPAASVALDAGSVEGALAQAARPAADGLEVNLRTDYKIHDGRFANNAWLQELPDPITKLVWDNAALISPATAKAQGFATGDVVTLTANGQSVDVPLFVLPGHADDSLTVSLGYGRKGSENTATGVGVNVNALRTAAAPWFFGGASLKKTHETYAFASTQGHWSLEGRKNIALDLDLAAYQQDAGASLTEHMKGPVATLQEPVEYKGYRWGMSIDLSRCTGCSACVVACRAENNVPTVGKDQVARGREMDWLRIDRYFVGEDENQPQVITQPMLCQHCETAPCEYVCPVNATVHSDEGLNEMVYNRCVGTRYCGNNCPYKVRRFNYFNWTGDKPLTERMAMNPDVTVRARGVMEKCSFCVQRIQRTRIDVRAKGDGTIDDGQVTTACAQACPTRAIVFGDLNDAKSQVAERRERQRRYDVLHDLGTRPRVGYLVRIRNPNPELA